MKLLTQSTLMLAMSLCSGSRGSRSIISVVAAAADIAVSLSDEVEWLKKLCRLTVLAFVAMMLESLVVTRSISCVKATPLDAVMS